jgi:hypothetical protein
MVCKKLNQLRDTRSYHTRDHNHMMTSPLKAIAIVRDPLLRRYSVNFCQHDYLLPLCELIREAREFVIDAIKKLLQVCLLTFFIELRQIEQVGDHLRPLNMFEKSDT